MTTTLAAIARWICGLAIVVLTACGQPGGPTASGVATAPAQSAAVVVVDASPTAMPPSATAIVTASLIAASASPTTIAQTATTPALEPVVTPTLAVVTTTPATGSVGISVSQRPTETPAAEPTSTAQPKGATRVATPTPKPGDAASTPSPKPAEPAVPTAPPRVPTSTPKTETSGAGLAQIAQGSRVYAQWCTGCHGARAQGAPGSGIPALAGAGQPLGNLGTGQNLYNFARTNMPQDNPGSLSSEQYYAVTAYLLSLNGINRDGAVVIGPSTAGNFRLK